MTPDIFIALTLFALVSSITPGPNNMMLLASGANFGIVRTLPHMAGVALGFVLMVLLVGAGIMNLFDRFPITYTVLKVLSIAYLIYLSYKVATAQPPTSRQGERGKPMTFIQAVLFQWVNPKAWTMALTAITVYAPSRDIQAVLWVALAYGLVNLPSVGVWVVLGQRLQRFLISEWRRKAFNGLMAALLLCSLLPTL